MSNFQLPPGFRPSQPPSSSSDPRGGGGGGGGPSPEEAAAAQDRARQQEEMKRGMMAAMLVPAARERLNRIAMTRPELAAQVEDLLVRMGQQGQIRGQVSDEALKGLLQQVSDPPKPTPLASGQLEVNGGTRTKTLGGGITIHRKRDDSDSDEYDL